MYTCILSTIYNTLLYQPDGIDKGSSLNDVIATCYKPDYCHYSGVSLQNTHESGYSVICVVVWILEHNVTYLRSSLLP